MDHPNATAYRRTADAFRAGDREALVALIDEGVVWHIPGSGPLAGDIHGRIACKGVRDSANAVVYVAAIPGKTFPAPEAHAKILVDPRSAVTAP